jgi:integrase
MSLEAARAAAGRLSVDGVGATTAGSTITFASARALYFQSGEFAGLSERTKRSYKWVLQSVHYHGFEARRLSTITRADILNLRDGIIASGKAHQNVLRPLQALLSWCVDRQMLEVSPASRLKLPTNRADPNPLSDNEAGMLLAASDQAESPVRELYLLTALCGSRPSFWCEVRWSEVNLKAATVTVSPTRAGTTKLGYSWTLPLSRQAVAILTKLAEAKSGPYVIGGDAVYTLEQKVRNRIAKAALLSLGDSRGTPGRWRSTMLSWLDEKGVNPEVALRLAGHSTGQALAGVRRHYLATKPTPEMRKWCQAWADYLDLLRVL